MSACTYPECDCKPENDCARAEDFAEPNTRVPLVAALRAEAAITEEFHEGDTEIDIMRRAADEIERLEEALHAEKMEHGLLQELLSRPEIDDFWEGIVTEAAHQRQRWGDAHDRDKSAENWFWLIGYLSGKALRAAIEGDKAKAKHHTISTAAALFQWHKAISADKTGRGIGRDEDIG